MKSKVLAMPSGQREALLWTLQACAAAIFLWKGGVNLVGTEEIVALHAALGVGQWFRILTGLFEVVGAVGLLGLPVAGLAASLLSLVTMGAIGTRLFFLGDDPLAALGMLVALGIVAWCRRPWRTTERAAR